MGFHATVMEFSLSGCSLLDMPRFYRETDEGKMNPPASRSG
jgi:hypothetical protein